MKESIKKELETELIAYLNNNDLIIDTKIYSDVLHFMKKNSKKQATFSRYIEKFINNTKFRDCGNIDDCFKFLFSLINIKEKQHLVLPFLLIKEDSSTYWKYEENKQKTLLFLKPYKEIYFHYVNRNKYLESNLSELNDYFLIIQDQEKRESIIERCLTLKRFSAIESQTFVYNLIEKSIKNKNKFKDYFPNIKKIDTNNEQELQMFKNSNKKEVIEIDIDLIYLNSVNLKRNMGMESFKNMISEINRAINNQSGVPSLNIERMNDEFLQNNGKIFIYGNNLNSQKINFFVNELLKEIIINDNYDDEYEAIRNSEKKAHAFSLTVELNQKDLPKINVKKQKI